MDMWGDDPVAARSGDTEHQAASAPSLILLHLAPGVVFTASFYFLSRVLIQRCLTAYLAELILVPTCLVPVLMGIVFLWTRRAGEKGSMWRAITYCDKGTVSDYVIWPVLLYACWGVCSLVLFALVGDLEVRFFSWFPDQLRTRAMISAVRASPSAQRQITGVLAFLLSGLLAPLAEEAYFRGFLLPRMRHWGWMAPVGNAFLFGLYHFFSPWALPSIFLAFLPVAFVVQAKRNFRIGLVVHSLFNLTGVWTLFVRSS
jgi:uncharacterized protein